MKTNSGKPKHKKSADNSFVGRLLRGSRRGTLLTIALLGLVGVVIAQAPGPVNLRGTGGTVTTPVAPSPAAGYVVHTFTQVGTTQFVPPPGVSSVDVLVVGGGGGGGRGGLGAGGGGGAGQYIQQTNVDVSGSVNVTVGGGGPGGTGANNTFARGTAGNSSSFGAVTAIGGGAGGSGNTGANNNAAANADRAGGNGGSGGGGGAGDAGNEGGAAGTGTAGGNGGTGQGAANNQESRRAGGGGGGAAAGAAGVGGNGSNQGNDGRGGNGGAGVTSTLFGGDYAGGGGGANTSANFALGGTGGGGNGSDDANAGAGAANSGGGGGGARNGNGGAGGSGIVIVRYLPSTLRITNDQQPATQLVSGQAFAAPDQPAVTLLNSSGAGVPNITVTASVASGSPTLSGTLTAVTDNNGVATFTNLILTGNGTSTLRLAVAGDAAVNFVVTNQITVAPESYTVQISHPAGGGGTCSSTPVTVTVRDAFNQVAVDFVGQITITSSPGTGNWANSFGGLGSFNNGAANDGIATYTFNTLDNGVVQLGYTNVAGNYTFNVTGPEISSVTNNGGTLSVTACQFRISHSGSSSVCAIEEITIRVTNTGGTVMTRFAGNLSLSTNAGGGGNWSKTSQASDALGALTPGGANSGTATYVFLATDEGEIKLNFQTNNAVTVNFNIVSAGVSAPASPHDPDLVVGSCQFRITHSQSSDVCSIEQILITLVDSNGATVTTYTGTINLSTTTGLGTWEDINLSDGDLVDAGVNNGIATYKFDASDQGTVTLGFRYPSSSGTVNINITDGITQDARDSNNNFDRNIAVALCTFEISHGQTSNACSVTQVTFLVRNSTGDIAEDYIGTVRITNNTGRGDWVDTAQSFGNLSAPSGPDTGIADYQFSPADEGTAVLRFYSTFPAIINFNTVDGVIIENGLFDPNLFYTGCFPDVFSGPACTNPNTNNPSTQININIPAENSIEELRSRMVLMATMQVTNNPGTAATFNAVNMDRVVQYVNGNVITEIWAILDDDLPDNAGSYTGSFNGLDNSTTICLLVIEGVEQAIPVAAPNPVQGPVNSSGYSGPVVNGFHNATTVISTENNNAFVFSAITNNYARVDNQAFNFWRPPEPGSILTGIWGGYVPPNPTSPPYREATLQSNPTGNFPVGGNSAGSAGVVSSAGVVEIVEPFQSNDAFPPSLNAHVVAAFNPLVTGQPLAEDYEPVVLFETYSGALNYRAIGNTLRTQPSPLNLSVDPAVDCAMVNFATGTTANLNVPMGSTVKAAYLYWSGSGTPAQIDSQVSFGLDGNEIPVVADEVFTAVGVTSVNASFFAGYADVTQLVSGNGTYRLKDLTVQTGNPWNTNGTCAGGWSLIVIYENQDEHLRVINLFHGFQPFQYSSFTLVPRNFRMATYDTNLLLPNGQVTHVTLEGDEQLSTGNESLQIQVAPDSLLFEPLVTSFNPANSEFNSTITRPLYWLGPSGYYEFVDEWDTPRDSPWTVPPSPPALGLNGDGYEIDFPGDDAEEQGRSGNRIGESWGFDIDTHYLSHTLLEDFAQPNQEAERFTTRYRSGQDGVILISEVISITNFPIADLEVFISQSGTFKVNGDGSYQISVTNNGNGTSIGGQATGIVTVAMRLPTGMTFLNAGDVGGTGWVCNAELDPGAFTCNYNIATVRETIPDSGNGQLLAGASLPAIVANVKVGSASIFTLQSNTRKASVRMLHNGGSCDVTPIGFIPDPRQCNRAPQFDNVNDTQGDTIDIDTLVDKSASNNNVHSVTTTVTGVTTNLRMQKIVSGSLETDQPGQYLLTVTNLGPDATTVPFTITDNQPTGVTFTGATGSNWSCNTITPTLSCTFSGTLALNASTVLTLNVDVVGNAGFNVTNTAQVTVGTGNFDLVLTNNAATDITTIVGPPVASQERFLLSVSTPGNETTIGGLGPFQNNDLIIYDPSTDEALMFFDDSLTNDGRIDDINAVHLLKNGHIILSANGFSRIGTNSLEFNRWDLVRYDPILGTASMFLEGEDVFGEDFEDININGVYILDDCAANNNNATCSVVFTTTTGGVAGSNNLTFTASDLVIYYRSGPNVGQAAIYLDGSDEAVFGAIEGSGNVNIDAFYLRVDPADPKAVLDVFVLSADNETAVIGEGLDPDPFTGTVFSRDDVTELNLENDTAQNLFLGDVELGIFEPEAAQRRLDALHLVEDGYIGHFSIRQEQGGSVCEAGVIRISKHDGLTHNRDLDYYGSVRINTSTNYGTWQLQAGNGLIENQGNGQAVYTFDSSDSGTVVLRLVHDQVATVNIAVTNGIAREIGSEDPNFAYDPALTQITWGDEFSNVSFSSNDGSRNFNGSWIELDAVDGTDNGGLGAGTGNIQIVSGRLRLASSVAADNAGKDPSLSRILNITSVPYSEDVILKMRYGHTALAQTDSMVVEIRGSSADDDDWVEVFNFTGASYTADLTNSSIPVEYNLTDILTAASQDFSESTQLRFRINNGYQLSNRFFFIDQVYIETATDQCGFTGAGSLDHYAISHDGFGISCVGSAITITAHDASNDPIDAGSETLNLSISPAKGTWARVLSGSGTLTPIASQSDNGQAQYVFAPGEETVTLLLNYTVPAGAPTPVNINVQGAVSNAVELEDPTLEIAEAGLVFYNESSLDTTIPTQIAGKPSNINPLANLLTIRGVRSSDADPLQCVPLFSNGQTLEIELAAECINAAECVNGETFSVTTSANNSPLTTDIALADNNGGNGASAYTPVVMDFVTQPSGAPAAAIVLNYSDVGQVQLHGRYNIPFGFFGSPSPDSPLNAPGYSEDFMFGSSNTFVVRPFGFAIDFPGDIGLDRFEGLPANNFEIGNSFADDSNGSVWQIAGAEFDTVVTAMAWQSADDQNNDGVPDLGANLHDNRATPNFFFDSNGQANNYRVELSVVENQAEAVFISEADPEYGVPGVLSNNILSFANFDNSPVRGTGLVNMSYNEVGIIDIQAQLIDSNDDPVAYFGTEAVTGRVNNVGRFYPAEFTVDGAVTLLPRVESVCTQPSSFTYMGEPFGLTLQLTARNLQGDPTVNYRGGFAKLDLYSELNMRVIEQVADTDNINRSSRLENISIPSNLQSSWSAADGGELQINGFLSFNRADPADPDGPFNELIIAFDPTDNDGVTLDPQVLNAEITDDTPEFLELARETFRYGRLLINNAYGPETEDLAITFRVEYFDGERFVINTDDSCTVINSNQLVLLAGTETGLLTYGPDEDDVRDTTILPAQTSTFHNGQIQGVQAATNPTDATFTAEAAGLDNAGTIDIELDLSPGGLNLPWLQFKWPHEDQDYDENPRATIEFGQFRSHDRVINWQEIYNGPTP